jgi:hypothetical protein
MGRQMASVGDKGWDLRRVDRILGGVYFFLIWMSGGFVYFWCGICYLRDCRRQRWRSGYVIGGGGPGTWICSADVQIRRMGCRIWTDDGGAHCRRSLISAAQLRLSLHYISSGFSLSLLLPPTPTAMDAPPLPTATPTTTAHAIVPAALFFLVPVFALVLVVRAVVDRPLRRRHGRDGRAYTAYAMLTLLTLLGALAGALPLSQALASHNSNGEVDGKRTGEVVQALIGLLGA